MDKIFRKKLIEVFKEIVDTLPDNFYELVTDGGCFFDIDFEIFNSTETDLKIGNSCIEKFNTEIIELSDGSWMINEQYRTRKYEDDGTQEIKFNQIIESPFKEIKEKRIK